MSSKEKQKPRGGFPLGPGSPMCQSTKHWRKQKRVPLESSKETEKRKIRGKLLLNKSVTHSTRSELERDPCGCQFVLQFYKQMTSNSLDQKSENGRLCQDLPTFIDWKPFKLYSNFDPEKELGSKLPRRKNQNESREEESFQFGVCLVVVTRIGLVRDSHAIPCPPGYILRNIRPNSSAWTRPAGVNSPPHLRMRTSDGSLGSSAIPPDDDT
jgi:hypothetical protein